MAHLDRTDAETNTTDRSEYKLTPTECAVLLGVVVLKERLRWL